MKKIIFITTMFFLFAGVCFAHPPKKVILTYDAENSTLKMQAIHPVKDVKDHYICLVTLEVDGKVYKTIELTEQTSAEEEDLSFDISDIEAGSRIDVTAKCNKMGSKTESILIE